MKIITLKRGVKDVARREPGTSNDSHIMHHLDGQRRLYPKEEQLFYKSIVDSSTDCFAFPIQCLYM